MSERHRRMDRHQKKEIRIPNKLYPLFYFTLKPLITIAFGLALYYILKLFGG